MASKASCAKSAPFSMKKNALGYTPASGDHANPERYLF